MDDWLGINSLPPVLTVQLGLAPQLSLNVTPQWAVDTVITASATSLQPLISTLRMIAELLRVIVMTAIVSASPIRCMVSIRLGVCALRLPKRVDGQAQMQRWWVVCGCCQEHFGSCGVFQTSARVAQEQCCPSGSSSS